MPFDPKTATPVTGAFDPKTAEAIDSPTIIGEAKKGFGRSFADVPGLVSGMAAYGADVVGADKARDSLLAYTKKSNEATERDYGSDAASFSNVIDGKASLPHFLANAAGYTGGQALQSLVTGGGGAIVGRMAAKKVAEAGAASLIEREVAAGAARKVAEEAGAKEAARLGNKAAWTGATVAGMGQNVVMEGGSIYPEAAQHAADTGHPLDSGDLARVGASTIGAAAVDTMADRIMAKHVLAGGKGDTILKRARAEVPAAMAREAGTEGIQTEIERYGAGQSMTDAEAARDVIDSMAVGAVGGAGGGIISSLHKQQQPVVAPPNSAPGAVLAPPAAAGAPAAPPAGAAPPVVGGPVAPPPAPSPPAPGAGPAPGQADTGAPPAPGQEAAPGETATAPGEEATPLGPPVHPPETIQGVIEAANHPHAGPLAIAAAQGVASGAISSGPGIIGQLAAGTPPAAISTQAPVPPAAPVAAAIPPAVTAVPPDAPAPEKPKSEMPHSLTNGPPVPVDRGAQPIDAGAHAAASSPHNSTPLPTGPQIEGKNAKLGHLKISGLDISIENPEGSIREDKHNTPPKWRTQMRHHYGYIKGTIGHDKDHVDAFVKPNTPDDWAGDVHIVNQTNGQGGFDEHKAMIGFDSEAEARAAYQANYQDGWDRGSDVVTMPMAEFKTWAKSEHPAKGPAQGTAVKSPENAENPAATEQPEPETVPEKNPFDGMSEMDLNEHAKSGTDADKEAVSAELKRRTKDRYDRIDRDHAANRAVMDNFKKGDRVRYWSPQSYEGHPNGRWFENVVEKILDRDQGTIQMDNVSIGARHLQHMIDDDGKPINVLPPPEPKATKPPKGAPNAARAARKAGGDARRAGADRKVPEGMQQADGEAWLAGYDVTAPVEKPATVEKPQEPQPQAKNKGVTLDDVPPGILKKVKVKVDRLVNGEVAPVEVTAHEALKDLDEEISAYEKLLACVRGA